MKVNPRAARFALSALFGLGGAVALLTASPAAAQGIPFIGQFNAASCNGGSTVCTVTSATVPAGKRWDITNINCRNNLTELEREIATLRLHEGATIVAQVPLNPINTTNSNAWIVSEELLVPVNPGRHIQIAVQSFDSAIVAGTLLCTMAGYVVTP